MRWYSPHCSLNYTQTHGLWLASYPSGPQARFWPVALFYWGQNVRRTLFWLTMKQEETWGGRKINTNATWELNYQDVQEIWLPWWLSWEGIHLPCRRPRLDFWVRKIPWRRERLPTPVFWPGEFHGLYNGGLKQLDMTERFSQKMWNVSFSFKSENSVWKAQVK